MVESNIVEFKASLIKKPWRARSGDEEEKMITALKLTRLGDQGNKQYGVWWYDTASEEEINKCIADAVLVLMGEREHID